MVSWCARRPRTMEFVLGITDFWTYVLGTAAIVLLPGPNSIFVLTVGAQRGVRMGYRAAAGVFVGDTVLMVLAAAGVASLLRAYPPVSLVIKYAGAAYLAWVGIGIIRSWLVVSLLNPKAILFVVSFFIQFVTPGYPYPALSFLVLGAVLQFFSVLYLTALIFSGQFLAGQFRRRRRLSAGMATGVGAVFVGFGIKLATASAG